MTPKPFPKETDLCAAFIAALPASWTAYAETAGWDILLVRKSDGFQIGVQAKLKLNIAVINQAIEDTGWWPERHGPDCRAVLVPMGDSGGFRRIGAYIGFTIIHVAETHNRFKFRFEPSLPDEPIEASEWFECCPTKRHRLPEYVPDVAAGSAAPIRLTPWKISAIKIAVILETRGYVTRLDFKHIGIDHRRWLCPGGYLVAEPKTPERRGGFVSCEKTPDLKSIHPRVYAEIAADAVKWMPPA